MRTQLFGAIALSLTASASTIERRSSIVLDICPTFYSRCACYNASLTRDCGWDSQALNGGQCKKGSSFDFFELEDESMDDCPWQAVMGSGHVHTNTDNCKQWTNACSCKGHVNEGCGWKSEFQIDLFNTTYDETNNGQKTVKSLGECRYGATTDQYELEDSNSVLADTSDGYFFDCQNEGCNKYQTPCECYDANQNGEDCGWSSSDYRNVEANYIQNKDFVLQGRCKTGSTTLGIEVAYYAYVTKDPQADSCIKDEASTLTDCEVYTNPCDCWEQGVINDGARCGWSSATKTCNYLSRFSQQEVVGNECLFQEAWTTLHKDEFEAESQSDVTTAAHVVQGDRVWPGTSDLCYWKDGVFGSFAATRCDCFSGYIGDTKGPNGESLTSCGWTGTKEEGMCQEDAAWDESGRTDDWAQEAFECLDPEVKRGLCDPYMNITKGCECASWSQEMATLNYYDVEAIVNDPSNTNPNKNDLLDIWIKVNSHIYGHLYDGDGVTDDSIKKMTPFLASSCWYDDNGNRVTDSQHDECMSWQFCGWSSEYTDNDNKCFHGKYTSVDENNVSECVIPEPEPYVPPPPLTYTHNNMTSCTQISDPIVCALYSVDVEEDSSAPFNLGCTWDSGAQNPCIYAQSLMELQEVMFPIQNGLSQGAQVKVGGSIYLTQHYKDFLTDVEVPSYLPSDSWVPHLPTLNYAHPWRPFVEADTCYVISDIMSPTYIPQSYIAEGDFDDKGSLYNCEIDGGDCFMTVDNVPKPYPNVLKLESNDGDDYTSGIEFLRQVNLKYINVTDNNNEGPLPGSGCTVANGCVAERQAVIDLTSALRAPLNATEADSMVVYTHAILTDLDGNPVLYHPCVSAKSGGAAEYVAARDAWAAGSYLESGLFGS